MSEARVVREGDAGQVRTGALLFRCPLHQAVRRIRREKGEKQQKITIFETRSSQTLVGPQNVDAYTARWYELPLPLN